MAKNQKPSVSYTLCVYNGAKTLSQSLGSILNQKRINLEVVAVNDGSTDNSLSILKRFSTQDKRIKIVNQPNLGLSFSRNIAISHCHGDFIASASQDDIYLPEKTIDQVNYLEKNNLDFCFTAVDIINQKSKIIPFYSKKIYNARLWPRPFDIIQVLIFMDVCSPTFLCRRKCYQKIKWNPGLILFNDKHLWLKMFLSFRGGKLNKISLLRRVTVKTQKNRFIKKYPLGFLYLEHRAAMLEALICKFIPAALFPSRPSFFGLVKGLLQLEKNPLDKKVYSKLEAIYRKLGYSFPRKYFRKKINIIPVISSN